MASFARVSPSQRSSAGEVQGLLLCPPSVWGSIAEAREALPRATSYPQQAPPTTTAPLPPPARAAVPALLCRSVFPHLAAPTSVPACRRCSLGSTGSPPPATTSAGACTALCLPLRTPARGPARSCLPSSSLLTLCPALSCPAGSATSSSRVRGRLRPTIRVCRVSSAVLDPVQPAAAHPAYSLQPCLPAAALGVGGKKQRAASSRKR